MIKYFAKYPFIDLIKILVFEIINFNKNFNFFYIKSKNPKYFDHIPTPYYYLYKIDNEIKMLKIRKKYFVDLGCGTGRAVNFFYNRGYKKIIGVEQSKKIFEICSNLKVSKKIILINKDVKKYHIPDNTGIIYIYNPGPSDLIKKIINKIKKKNFKNLIVIYVTPKYIKLFNKKNFEIIKKDYNKNFVGYVILKFLR